MTYAVTLTREALEDLLRLEDFLVESALQHGDWDLPRRAIATIRTEFRILETNPFTCRVADTDRLERELVIPFGASGYVALFRVISEREVVVAAIRHQREDDYH
ncbi:MULTISPECIES: type II toxin-antitoxin system RelE/ParE family toxin [Variovorax]|uniref:type II toxin-antitoxin system RelE/ParE family toxin n=1 Tax=Variovorax TaxID=34072 RepID=UPI00285BC089|nr:type II toxin-antitoxin system RelE/ParE family toxin [Variovorax sp. 3319]MDR6890714.1 plasmid stabilization system protein ParE [Variovorax sp. 3319]